MILFAAFDYAADSDAKGDNTASAIAYARNKQTPDWSGTISFKKKVDKGKEVDSAWYKQITIQERTPDGSATAPPPVNVPVGNIATIIIAADGNDANDAIIVKSPRRIYRGTITIGAGIEFQSTKLAPGFLTLTRDQVYMIDLPEPKAASMKAPTSPPVVKGLPPEPPVVKGQPSEPPAVAKASEPLPTPIFYRTPETFSHTPLVQRVPNFRIWSQNKQSPGETQELPSVEVLAQKCGQVCWKFRFDGAANVPIPQFGPNGEPECEEGALIYEGMRIVVAQDGSYEVRFNLSTPAMPTALRLQLAVLDRVGRPIILTLPPIVAGYNDDFQTNFWRQQWHVYHAGHSDALAQAFDSLHTVARIGTGRFGSRPWEINPGGRLYYSSLPFLSSQR
jgi:hypothetical protein